MNVIPDIHRKAPGYQTTAMLTPLGSVALSRVSYISASPLPPATWTGRHFIQWSEDHEAMASTEGQVTLTGVA